MLPREAIPLNGKSGAQIVRDNIAIVSKALAESENKVIFSWIALSKVSLQYTYQASNQIVLLFKSGVVEVLPRGIYGDTGIRQYIGHRYTQITHWSALPFTDNRSRKNARDLYAKPL